MNPKKPSLLVFATLGLAITIFTSISATADSREASWRGQSVTEFTPAENEALGWRIVNDGVMGGLSEGSVEFTKDGTMRFSGNLSLKNNGGFSTARSESLDLNLSNDLGLLLLVKGDGRTYEARLDSDARYRGNPVSFAGKFSTTPGKWEQVKIPFASFEGSWRGTELPDAKLDPSVIERLWIMMADKQEGPFDLEIQWVRTYGKGQGNFTERQAKPDSETEVTAPGDSTRIIATAVADGRFTILKKALDAAGLTPFFQWDNPLTVFAPTDEAFAKLPDGVLEDLLKPENKQKLTAILSYHVAPGASEVADALQASKVEVVQNRTLKVAFSDGRVRVNDAALIDGDIECSDGIIHVIDTVLLPPEPKPEKPTRRTVLTVAEEAGDFGTLLAAIGVAELGEVLESEGPFTIFAPSEKAFRALPEGTVESLLKKENRDDLVELLRYHVVPGRVSAGDALNAGEAETAQGETLQFAYRDGRLQVNDSTIQAIDLDGGNGIIHVIDSVLIPSS